MDSRSIPTPTDVAELSGPELDQALVDIETARRTLEAAYVAVLDRADTTERYRHDGHVSVRGWIVALTNSSPVETRRRLQTMRALRDLPSAGRALADGTIGVDPVRAIAQLHPQTGLRDLVVDGDAKLAAHARKDYATFSDVLHNWSQFGDPRGDEDRHAKAHEQRQATIFERDGIVHLHAKCGRDAGGAWHVHRPDGTELTQPAAA